jgi:aspartyl-tRNA(Asn)/glutamyl-tRNA(Gln) amidotransferase subunit A
MPLMPDDSLPFLGLRAVARRIATGEVSPIEVVDAILERVDALEPSLNTFIWRNPGTRSEAERADQAVRQGGRVGPLHGVPLTIKDLILTRDAPTTAGSRIFGEGVRSRRDAPVVRRLRRAGAILLGKTNLHEIAMGVTTANEHFGPTRNPWDPTRIPGGSSGGSAAALAAGFGYGSVGTDTRGSIRIPAACCGVTGLKPTYGLVPTQDVIPLSWSLDHVGPMTRSVEDAAVLLGVMAGGRARLERWLAAADSAPERLRLGLCHYYLRELDPAIEGSVADAITLLERAGHRLAEVEIAGLTNAHAASGVITGAEAYAFHEEHLREQPEGFGPLVRGRLEQAASLTAVQLVRAERTRREMGAAFARGFDVVDCLIGATVPAFPPRIGDTTVRHGDREEPVLEAFTRLNSPQNMAGIPALVLPCGFGPDGLPVGLQLIAAAGREDLLLRLGAEYQRETDWHRRRPVLSP